MNKTFKLILIAIALRIVSNRQLATCMGAKSAGAAQDAWQWPPKLAKFDTVHYMSIHYTVCREHYTVCREHYTVFSRQCEMCRFQCEVCKLKCACCGEAPGRAFLAFSP